LERLCANERAAPSHPAVIVHVADPSPPGPGQVWRADQSRHLLMNTVAAQVTVYTDDSLKIDGPIEPGPSLYDWARQLSLLGPLGDHDEQALAEARELGPDTYPTRALYGQYLAACFRRIVAQAPEHVKVHVHRSRAVAMADTHGVTGGPQGVRLENGTRLNDLDAIVLALGHVPARLTPRQERTAALARIHYLTYITPANPADVDLSGIRPGQNVLLRGLGLNFFDYMALLTVGRGGSFSRAGDRLVYLPSGREPKMYASSRRGVPYHARGENQKGPFGRYYPRLLTKERIARLRARAADGEFVQFATDLWPLICKEVESVYYATLLESRGQARGQARGQGQSAESLTQRYLALRPGADSAALLAEFGIAPADRWDWEQIANPCRGQKFADRDEFRNWLMGYLDADVRHARAGNVEGPRKAALDVLRDLRNEVRLAVDHSGLDGNSHRDDLDGWYTPLNAFLSIGPPVSRVQEMIALIEAGILEVTGPGTEIRFDSAEPGFVAESRLVPGPAVRSTALIEARLPEPDLRRTDDPLLRHLLATEQVGPYRIPGSRGTVYETGGLAVSERPYRLLDARGRAHPRRFAFGVPTEAVHWATAAGIRPGVDSVTLGDSDAIARAVVALPPVAEVPSQVRPSADDTDLTGVVV
jgi:hypothetical protein